jgi:hypothetical protein
MSSVWKEMMFKQIRSDFCDLIILMAGAFPHCRVCRERKRRVWSREISPAPVLRANWRSSGITGYCGEKRINLTPGLFDLDG